MRRWAYGLRRDTLLTERLDFARRTTSRSTKPSSKSKLPEEALRSGTGKHSSGHGKMRRCCFSISRIVSISSFHSAPSPTVNGTRLLRLRSPKCLAYRKHRSRLRTRVAGRTSLARALAFPRIAALRRGRICCEVVICAGHLPRVRRGSRATEGRAFEHR